MSEEEASFAAPVLLTEAHDGSDFASGESVLDDWLRLRAIDNLKNAASRSYVICPAHSNKIIGYLQHGTKEQPFRTDSSNRLGAPVHLSSDSTTKQDSPSWVYKGEWNSTLTQNMFAEFRAGQFGYNFGLNSNGEGTRYENWQSIRGPV